MLSDPGLENHLNLLSYQSVEMQQNKYLGQPDNCFLWDEPYTIPCLCLISLIQQWEGVSNIYCQVNGDHQSLVYGIPPREREFGSSRLEKF